MLRSSCRLLALHALALVFSTGAATASVSVLTGEDLFDSPDVTFPTTQPSLDGTSLVFGPGNQAHEKLFELLIIQAGALSLSGSATVSITINLTRLPCSSGCAGNENDFDPHVMIGDGSRLVGGLVADNGGGQGFAVEMDDAGNVGTNRRFTVMALLTPIIHDGHRI